MTVSVKEARDMLHQKVRDMEPIDPEEVAKVNTYSRMALLREKTMEMTAKIAGTQAKDIQKELDIYDALAIDWVYSQELEWEGSLPEKQMQKILAMAT